MSFDGVRPMQSWDATRAKDLKDANSKLQKKLGDKFSEKTDYDTTAQMLAARMDDTGNDQVLMLGFGQCALDVAGALQIKDSKQFGKYVTEGKGAAESYQQRLELANKLLKEKKMNATSVPTGTVFDLNKIMKDSNSAAKDKERLEALKNHLKENKDQLSKFSFKEKTSVTDLAKTIIALNKGTDSKYGKINLKTPEDQRKFDKLVQKLREDTGLKGLDLTLKGDKNKIDLTKYIDPKKIAGSDGDGADQDPREADGLTDGIKDTAKYDDLKSFTLKADETPKDLLNALVKLKGIENDTTKKTELETQFKDELKNLSITDLDKALTKDQTVDLTRFISEDEVKKAKQEDIHQAFVGEGGAKLKNKDYTLEVHSMDTNMEIAKGLLIALQGNSNHTTFTALKGKSDDDLLKDSNFNDLLKGVATLTGETDNNKPVEEAIGGKTKTLDFKTVYETALANAN